MPRHHRARLWRSFAALGAAFLCLAPPALAARENGACGHRETVVAELEKDSRQLPVAASVTHDGVALLWMANEITGIWTVLIIDGQVACQLEHGEGWHDLRIWRPIELAPEEPDAAP